MEPIKTSVTVAHRLSTVQDADMIYVMDQGAIVEFGTHDHLMSLEGRYHALVHQQMVYEHRPSVEDHRLSVQDEPSRMLVSSHRASAHSIESAL
jgi:ABC-type multidrug transport system ATPase subunit